MILQELNSMNSIFFFQLKLRSFFEVGSEANLSFLSLQSSHEVNILFTKKTGKQALEREGKQAFRGIPSTGL